MSDEKSELSVEEAKKLIDSGELDEAIGEELDAEVGLTPEDLKLLEGKAKP